VIRSLADKRTAAIFLERPVRGIGDALARAAKRKLDLLHAAIRIEDLAIPPGNHLEMLRGDRAGHWAIRVNEQ
jgi:proteic killer suppression protein